MLYNYIINIKEKPMRIKDLREDHDLTQSDVADYLHIKQNTYSQYETGQRQLPLECLIALAKLYKTSTDYILGLTQEKKPYN
jgi:transcriptional regulator with XRE-family HTH domain